MSFLSNPFFHLYAIGILFFLAGLLHFLKPSMYINIMPDYIPAHQAMVFWSGVFEVLGGIGILIPQTRWWASWGLILLLIAVFPANIDMFVKAMQRKGLTTVYSWATLLRLPLQFVLMYWIYRAGIKGI